MSSEKEFMKKFNEEKKIKKEQDRKKFKLSVSFPEVVTDAAEKDEIIDEFLTNFEDDLAAQNQTIWTYLFDNLEIVPMAESKNTKNEISSNGTEPENVPLNKGDKVLITIRAKETASQDLEKALRYASSEYGIEIEDVQNEGDILKITAINNLGDSDTLSLFGIIDSEYSDYGQGSVQSVVKLNESKKKLKKESAAGNIYYDLTDEGIQFVQNKCEQIHDELSNQLDMDEDNEQLQIEVMAWEQFCQNLGIEGFDFS